MACLSFLIQYIGDTPPNPKSAKMCMNSISYLYAHIYVECFLCIVVYLTTMGPNEFGNHFVLECCFSYNGYALDACLIHKEGVLTMIL